MASCRECIHSGFCYLTIKTDGSDCEFVNRNNLVRWIPVTERLPDKMCQCICRYVFGENAEYPFYQILWYFTQDKKPHFQNEGSIGMRVTHWMPLPEPPKEE